MPNYGIIACIVIKYLYLSHNNGYYYKCLKSLALDFTNAPVNTAVEEIINYIPKDNECSYLRDYIW